MKEAKILNRVIRVTDQGWEYEADQRHADLIIQETGASSRGTLSHPGGEKRTLEEEAASKELAGAEATRFRAVAARATYLSADRPDIQYSAKGVPADGETSGRRLAEADGFGRYLKGPRDVPWSAGGKKQAVPLQATVTATRRGTEPPAKAHRVA